MPSLESAAAAVVSGAGDLGLMDATLPSRPAGDPQALRDTANHWIALARGLGEVIAGVRAKVAADVSQWQGPGKDTFLREWTHLAAAAEDACDQLAQAGSRLFEAADKLEQAQKQYDVVLAGNIAATLAGMALAPVTFGGAGVAAVAEGAGTAAAGFAVVMELSAEAAALIGAAVRAAVLIAEQIAARFVAVFGVDLGVQAGVSVAEFHSLLHVNVRTALGDALAGSAPDDVRAKNPAGQVAVTAALSAGAEAASEAVGGGQVNPLTVLFGGVKGASGPVSEQLVHAARNALAKRGGTAG